MKCKIIALVKNLTLKRDFSEESSSGIKGPGELSAF